MLGSVNPKTWSSVSLPQPPSHLPPSHKDSKPRAITIYVLVAVLGVAAPILVAAFLGDRSAKVLDGWKVWLAQNNATVMSVLFLSLVWS